MIGRQEQLVLDGLCAAYCAQRNLDPATTSVEFKKIGIGWESVGHVTAPAGPTPRWRVVEVPGVGPEKIPATKAHKAFDELFELMGSQRTAELLDELVSVEREKRARQCVFQPGDWLRQCRNVGPFIVRGRMLNGNVETRVEFRSCPAHLGHMLGRPPKGQWSDSRWTVDRVEKEGE